MNFLTGNITQRDSDFLYILLMTWFHTASKEGQYAKENVSKGNE